MPGKLSVPGLSREQVRGQRGPPCSPLTSGRVAVNLGHAAVHLGWNSSQAAGIPPCPFWQQCDFQALLNLFRISGVEMRRDLPREFTGDFTVCVQNLQGQHLHQTRSGNSLLVLGWRRPLSTEENLCFTEQWRQVP